MSAPAKEPQPLGSTTGKREDVRICVRCGKEMQMVGRNAKYCLLCRGEVYRERARAYRASHHASANTGADWAGISYGQLMLKSPAAREALILDYKAAKGGTP